jgi:hypothetical protein
MCTVSYVNVKGKVIITSNRDESILRADVLEPKAYHIKNKKLYFPKDIKGGTWYAVDEKSNVVVLLNGAHEKYISNGNYIKSRGLVVLDILSGDSLIEAWYDIDLNLIEPFTLVIFDNKNLYQVRWDGFNKETIKLHAEQQYIWSSTSLYSQEVREKREILFEEFLNTTSIINEKELFNFHRYTEQDNKENGFIINRDNFLKTLSITQTVIDESLVEMYHFDLVKNQRFNNSFFI